MSQLQFPWKGTVVGCPDPVGVEKVYVETVNDCAHSCGMCFRRTFSPQDRGMMSRETLEKLLHDLEAFEEKPTWVWGGLGEPTAHPDFAEFLQIVSHRGYAMQLSSNGLLLEEEHLESLFRSGVRRLLLSLDPHALGHPGAGKVQQVLRQLQRRKVSERVGLEVFVVTVFGSRDLSGLWEFCEWLQTLAIDGWILSGMIPVEAGQVEFSHFSSRLPVEVDRGFSSLIRRARGKFPFFEPVRLRPAMERECPFIARNATVVRYDGKVSACYPFSHDHVHHAFGRKKEVAFHSFGDIWQDSLKDVWNSRGYRVFRSKVRLGCFPYCIDCDQVESCALRQTTAYDCLGNHPSCAECPYYHRLSRCP
ncbi:MAG TPA: radical SAM protein [Thermotogota bacterium]|nr:radical SAM protein [Thermotogota bacterium]HRW92361.1 radical SAM protein [Thermotogota bacterium]